MHEISLMETTLSVALEQAKRQGATQIHQLKMQVGELSGVVPEALAFAFDALSVGTLAQGAKLILETVPVQCYCEKCQRVFSPKGEFARWVYECPSCRTISADIRQGKELAIASLEIS